MECNVVSSAYYDIWHTDIVPRFHWVSCQLEELWTSPTKGKLKETLQSLPTTLGGTYEHNLDRIPKHHCKYVLQVLQWLAFSKHPLALQELSAALEVDIRNGAPVKDDNRVLDPWTVLNMCSNLVTIALECVNKDGVHVQLAHLSIQNYLTSEQIQMGKTL